MGKLDGRRRSPVHLLCRRESRPCSHDDLPSSPLRLAPSNLSAIRPIDRSIERAHTQPRRNAGAVFCSHACTFSCVSHSAVWLHAHPAFWLPGESLSRREARTLSTTDPGCPKASDHVGARPSVGTGYDRRDTGRTPSVSALRQRPHDHRGAIRARLKSNHEVHRACWRGQHFVIVSPGIGSCRPTVARVHLSREGPAQRPSQALIPA